MCVCLIRGSGKLEVAISEGLPESAQDIDLYPAAEGNGICGYVAATGRSYICHDIEKDEHYVSGLEHARSSITVPVRYAERVVGVCNIESVEPHAFTSADMELTERLCARLGAAVHILNLLIVERAETCRTVAEGVIGELRGAWQEAQAELAALSAGLVDEESATMVSSLMGHLRKLDDLAARLKEGPAVVVMGAFAVEEDAGSPLSDKRVLVADDDERVRTGVAQVLERLGCQVTLAQDGYQAQQALDRQDFDLVVSDIRMPYRNGYEIYAAAQRARPGMPVVLMTGFGYDPNHSIVAGQSGRADLRAVQAV